MVKFISYDGKYPNLCSGNLILEIDGVRYDFGSCLCSGGSCGFDSDWMEHVESGRWTVDVPKKFLSLKSEIEAAVNESVQWGCCGGCL